MGNLMDEYSAELRICESTKDFLSFFSPFIFNGSGMDVTGPSKAV